MNGVGRGVLRGMVRVPVALTIAVLGVMAPVGVASAQRPSSELSSNAGEPTTLSLVLEGGGSSEASVTVSEGTPVRASAVLAGPNASSAVGRVTYHVFADAGCEHEVVVIRGSRAVQLGVALPSKRVELPAGTYYWQAAYSGRAGNAASLSECGSSVETVVPFLARACTSAVGVVRDLVKGGRSRVSFKVSTDLGVRQRFQVHWGKGERVELESLRRAWCTVKMHRAVFFGVGEGLLDRVVGVGVRFRIDVFDDGRARVGVHVREDRALLDRLVEEGAGSRTAFFEGGSAVVFEQARWAGPGLAGKAAARIAEEVAAEEAEEA